jgi:hypothetical protein
MKNIHLIATEKPSKIFYIAENFHLEKGQLIEPKSYHNVYITSDEEIKEGDAYISKHGGICKKHNGSKILLFKTDKKIILTTDQDLINCFCTCCGVQAIYDTFLEWFVKNPSCERVEVTQLCKIGCDKLILNGINSICCGDKDYKIIIPQEESKQETLEEAAKKHINGENKYNRILCGHSFVEGAKWQQERSYSEEDMIRFAEFVASYPDKNKNVHGQMLHAKSKYDGAERTIDLLQVWFEQFKKK